MPQEYTIEPDKENGTLGFTNRRGENLSALELAEYLLSERLLEMKL